MTRTQLAALVLLSAAACKKSAPKPALVDAPARVELVAAASHHFEPVADLGGEIRPASLANLTTQVDGKITQLTVDEGDKVKVGQLLAVIDDAMARANVERALAAVGVARAAAKAADVQLTAAKSELARSERLFAAKAIDEQTIEAARSRVAGLEAQVGTAGAQIHQAQAEVIVTSTGLAQHRITSPIAGVVARRYPRLHEYIGQGKPIFDLIDTSEMELVTKVPEDAARTLQAGGTLKFDVPSLGKSFDGKVVAVVPQLDPASRTLRVRARIDNPNGELLDGMYARARVPAGAPREGVSIPEPALRGEGGDRYVWVVKEGKVDRVTVVSGASEAGLVEIQQGLTAGDQVVLGGADGLHPGAKVVPAAAPLEAKAGKGG
jgi:membrane fusion protein (multidrug efflux system)